MNVDDITATLPIAKILSVKNEREWVSMVSYFKITNKNENVKEKLKSWEPLRSCLLNSKQHSQPSPILVELGLISHLGMYVLCHLVANF